jgi:hypothetical protein
LLRCDSGLIERRTTIIYRDLSAGSDAMTPWPADGAILLDSLERSSNETREWIASGIQKVLAERSAIVIASREPQLAIALLPPMTTLSVLHLRLGHVVERGDRIIHRVAEAAGGSY